MENRHLQNKRSSRRKRRVKRKKKNRLFKRIIILILAVIIFYLLIRLGISIAGKFMNNSEKVDTKPVETTNDKASTEDANQNKSNNNDLSLALEEQQKAKKNPIDTNITTDKKMKELDKRVNALISDEKVAKEKLSIGYFNLVNNESKLINEKATFGVGSSNNFMIAMAVYDIVEDHHLDIDDEIEIVKKEEPETAEEPKKELDRELTEAEKAKEKEAEIPRVYTIKGLIELMMKSYNQEAKDTLIKFIEDQSSKNWFDEINSRYGVNISYKNEMTVSDSIEMLRALFEQRKLDLKEKKDASSDRKLKYQELISMMVTGSTNSSISPDALNKSLFAENKGNDYMDYTSMGFVLKNPGYIYVIMSGHNNKEINSKALSVLDQWHNYYNN